MNRVIARYHEVALKRGNRPAFVSQLVENIAVALRGTGVKRVRSGDGRIIIHLRTEADWREIERRLRWVCGVANYSLALRSERNIDEIIETAVALAQQGPFASFAVRTRRGDKTFPLSSPEINQMVGAAIQAAGGARVDLDNPERVIHIEVVRDEAFISADRIAGVGGLPVGSSGTVLALLSGGIDSPVAAWRLMRRGCRVDFVHFHGAPYQDRSSRDKVIELARLLTRYQLRSRLHLVAFGEIQRQIVASVQRPFRVVLYRRMMMRIAEAIALRSGAEALVSGESLGQVASQTLTNLATVGAATALPLLRPLVGMDKQEISDQARKLDTYEISILPDEDCCQLFMPRHPGTRVRIESALAAEALFDVPALVQQALEAVEVEDFRFPPATPHFSRSRGAEANGAGTEQEEMENRKPETGDGKPAN